MVDFWRHAHLLKDIYVVLFPQGRGALYDIESDLDSISTGTSEGSTPNLDRRGRKVSAGSDESGESLGSAGLFKVTK